MTSELQVKAQNDSDDQLSIYYRNIGLHSLLTPEYERGLARRIVAAEVATWKLLLSCVDIAHNVLDKVSSRITPAPRFPKLLDERAKLLHALLHVLGPFGTEFGKSYAAAVKSAATRLRGLDLDRLHVDAVIQELPALLQAIGDDNVQTTSFVEQVRTSHRAALKLRDEFIKANLRLVVTMARRYDRGGMPLADLIQEGNLGLIHAVPRFDPGRRLRFSTYACWWIRHFLGRGIANKGRGVRVPVHMLEAQQTVERLRHGLQGQLGRPPTSDEVEVVAKAPLEKLEGMHRCIMGPSMSLDMPMHDDDGRSFGDTIADPETEERNAADILTTHALTAQVARHMHILTPMEADILARRFGLDGAEELNFSDIGEKHSLSRERIRQIQNIALGKLRAAMEAEHGGKVII